MKKIIPCIVLAFIAFSCNNSGSNTSGSETPSVSDQSTTSGGSPSYDPKRGEGPYSKVDISPSLNAMMADAGKKVYSVKCSACHKLTDEKLVGPGWKGVTTRHSAEWIMNFATDPDDMITKDPKAQAMLEICLVRMPNQNLVGDDARNVFEFMRQNDGVK
jgi:cytochrome c5